MVIAEWQAINTTVMQFHPLRSLRTKEKNCWGYCICFDLGFENGTGIESHRVPTDAHAHRYLDHKCIWRTSVLITFYVGPLTHKKFRNTVLGSTSFCGIYELLGNLQDPTDHTTPHHTSCIMYQTADISFEDFLIDPPPLSLSPARPLLSICTSTLFSPILSSEAQLVYLVKTSKLQGSPYYSETPRFVIGHYRRSYSEVSRKFRLYTITCSLSVSSTSAVTPYAYQWLQS